MMDPRAFIEDVLRAAKARNVQAEVFALSAESVEAGASEGVLERYKASKTGGLSLRVNINGRSGYAYTERCENADNLVERALDNARSIESGDEHPMQGRCSYGSVSRPVFPLEGMPHSYKIELALSLEKRTLALDPRVKRVVYCDIGTGTGRITIRNSLGLEAARQSASSYAYVMPVVEEDGELKTGFGFRLHEEAADLDACAREAVERALDKLHASPVPSGSYRVILGNIAMADLLEAFTPMFSAEEAQKGCSLLAEREGQRIGADCISITDNPFHAIAPRAFDDEGTPCRKKRVVDHGIFKTLLHNQKTAKKAGVPSTGNGYRASAASPIDAAPSVFYIEPGSVDVHALTERLGDGLFITELAGLHAGLSTVSGDFSLQACGKLIEHGEIIRAVDNITLAGNFLELLQHTELAADDLRFTMPGGVYTASPSLLISSLSVGGE